MKKVLAIALAVAMAFPAASLMAQQAPAKVQPVQVAYQGAPEGAVGMSMGAAVAVAVAVVVVAVASSNDNTTVATATATR